MANERQVRCARSAFEKAVRLDPDLLEAQLNLGRIYKMMGAETQARSRFEEFLKRAKPADYAQEIGKIREELRTMRR